jgi:acyl transferase domain-containing protein
VDKFDHLEFGISTRDAKGMSLSTRKALEHAFLALLDSEIDYRGRNVGVWVACELHPTADPVGFFFIINARLLILIVSA